MPPIAWIALLKPTGRMTTKSSFGQPTRRSRIPQEAQDEYAGKDAWYTLKLYHELNRQLKEASVPESLVKQVHDVAFALLDTEIQGVTVDISKIKELGVTNRVKCLELKEKMYETCQTEIEAIEKEALDRERAKRKTEKGKDAVPAQHFNWGSTMQLQSLLYSALNLPVQYSNIRKATVDDNALSKLESHHPVVPLLRQYRAEEKVFSAFLEAMSRKQNMELYIQASILMVQ